MAEQIPSWYEEVAEDFGHLLIDKDGNRLSKRAAAKLIGRSDTTTHRFLTWYWNRDQPAPQPQPARLSDRTWVDERSGTVFTDLGPDYGLISFTQGEFRSIRRDYSKHWKGKAETRQTITIRYGFPTIHAFEEFAKIHELRQNAIPFTDEELEEEGVDALVDKSIESKRQKFMLDLSAKEMEQQKRDAEKWRAFEVNAELIARSVAGAVKNIRVQPARADKVSEPYAAIIGLTDEHSGRRAIDHKGNELYTLEIAANRYRAAVHDFARQLAKEGKPECIYLVAASDGCHFDNGYFTTEKGTDQKAQSNSSYRDVVSTYVHSVLEGVLHLSQIAPVEVMVVAGNHDRQTAAMVGMMLEFALEGREDIRVHNSIHPRTYVAWGNNTFCFEHGDGVSPGKRQNEAARMFLVETAEQGVPLNQHRIVFAGDLHAEAIHDLGGVQYIVMPSLAKGADSWHRQSRYVGTADVPAMYFIRKKGGKSAIRYADPDALNSVI